MAKRRTSMANAPLEWIAIDESIAAAGANELRTFDLQLDDDEVAEILGIDSDISLVNAAPVDADVHSADVALLTDPSYTTTVNPYDAAAYEDLECFWTHTMNYAVEASAGGQTWQPMWSNKQTKFEQNFGVLVGTNPSALLRGDQAAGTKLIANFNIRLYFKRKKAGNDLLARILLKRR